MDFSKMKKILIILCIVSVLLNIISKFSKVFALELGDKVFVSGLSPDYVTIDNGNVSNYSYYLLYNYVTSSNDYYSYMFFCDEPFKLQKINTYPSGLTRYRIPSGVYSGLLSVNTADSRPNNTNTSFFTFNNLTYQTNTSGYVCLWVNSNGEVTDNAENVLAYQNVSNFDLYDTNNDLIIEHVPDVSYPELLNNSLTLENLSLQSYNISAGDYEDITFYALFYDRSILTQDNFWDYPNVVIELSPNNQYWLDGDTNQKYDVPITDVPLTYKPDTTYSIAFATKQYSSTGGGFRGDDFTWEFLGSPRSWTTLPSGSISTDLDNLNNQTDKQNLINYQNNVTNNLNNIYGSLTGTDTTDNDNLLAQSGVITENNQDITASGFDNIFNMFYNGITANPVDIVLPIPFTQQTITIQPDYIRNALGSNNIILNLIESFWYFAVSLYIVKDIESLIRKMKNGDVATSSDTNIKADML